MNPSDPQAAAGASSTGPARRGFLATLAGIALACVAFATPVVAAIAALLTPLRYKAAEGEPMRLALLDTLPADGTPRKVAVVAESVDAWSRSRRPVGAVYLRRTGPQEVQALQAVCPHAGCTVEFRTIRDEATGEPVEGFLCPCHKGAFHLDGKRATAITPSPRDMDSLAVEIRNGNEVWVQFQTFQPGLPAKVPLT